MKGKEMGRSSGARQRPDVIQFDAGRRFKGIERIDFERRTFGQHRHSSHYIFPNARNAPWSNVKSREESLAKPLPNFSDYTYRRSRRIYNKALNEHSVVLSSPIVKNEDDPMMRLQNFGNYKLDDRETAFKDMYMACLGLKSNQALHKHGKDTMTNGEFIIKEIPLEELFAEGYMVYPHDLLSPAGDSYL